MLPVEALVSVAPRHDVPCIPLASRDFEQDELYEVVHLFVQLANVSQVVVCSMSTPGEERRKGFHLFAKPEIFRLGDSELVFELRLDASIPGVNTFELVRTISLFVKLSNGLIQLCPKVAVLR